MKALMVLPSVVAVLSATVTTVHGQLVVPFLTSETRARTLVSVETDRPITGTETDQLWSDDVPRPIGILPPPAPYAANINPHVSKRSDVLKEHSSQVDAPYTSYCDSAGSKDIFFSIANPNGTLFRDPWGMPALFYVKTNWVLTYKKILRKALFNDPICKNYPMSHCISEEIPPTPELWDSGWVLKYTKDPILLFQDQDQWGGLCEKAQVREVRKLGVKLGEIGYFVEGASFPPAVLYFVEAKIRSTYPTVEITLICIFTVGLIPTIYALECIYRVLRAVYRMLATWVPKIWAATKAAPKNGCEKIKGAWDWVVRRRSESGNVRTTSTELSAFNLEQHPASRPPSYKTNDERVWRALSESVV